MLCNFQFLKLGCYDHEYRKYIYSRMEAVETIHIP
jgi:hypothetical protein